MKKRILTMLTVLTALLLFGAISANAEIIDSGECGNNVTYTLDNEGTLIISGTGDMGYFFGWGTPWKENKDKVKEVIIEEGVTSIGTCAFDCVNLKKVTLADTVERIDFASFSGCSALEEISFSQNLTTIGEQAFSGCTSLKEIAIPDNVTEIGKWAFSECVSLEHVNIGKGLENIWGGYTKGSFEGCTSLKDINVSESNENYASIDGVLYNKQITSLIKYPEGKTHATYSVPDSVTSISEVFCDYLETVEISQNVSEIYGFHEVIKGNLLKTINVADENPNFTSFNGVLFDKEMTTLIQYPAGKENIEYSIPESVTDISYNAFINAIALEKIVIPKDVSTIIGLFSGCTGLTDITVAPENQSYCSLDGILFSKNKSTLICYPSSKQYDFYSIPENVTEIYSFENCKYLKTVTVPSGIKRLTTFNNCTALETISIPKSVTLVNYNSFENVNVKDVYYEGSEDEWKRIEMRESGWFQSANIHYNSVLEPKLQPIPITTIAVTRTYTETEWQFEVEVGETYANSYVYAVIYDEDDKMANIARVPLETEGSTTVTTPKSTADKTAKIFVWTSKMQPITETESVDL